MHKHLLSAVSCFCCLELLSLGDEPAFRFTATTTVATGTSGVAAAAADDGVCSDDDNDNDDDDDENGPWQSTRQNTGQNSKQKLENVWQSPICSPPDPALNSSMSGTAAAR